jgi:hypothetical protein
MTGPGASSGGGDRNKRVELGGADAVPDTPSTAKRQGAEPSGTERRLTPRGAATETKSGSGGISPVVWIVIAIVVIAVGYFLLGR